jgi:cytochrome c biogenesis protein CcmG/thiol:disulfide interchange protein DsbE
VWVAVTLVAAGVVAILALGLQSRPDAQSSPIVDKPAPSFALASLNGRKVVSLESVRGQPVVLNFFASWCDSCKVEHPQLIEEWQHYAPSGVRFFGVMYQDTRSGARGFLRTYGGGWPVLDDTSGATAIDYGVTGVPETVVIDRRGVVVDKEIGEIQPEKLSRELDVLLKERA